MGNSRRGALLLCADRRKTGLVYSNAGMSLKGTSKNPNSVAMLRCSINFNAYISNICGALKFLSRLAWLRILNF